MPTHATGDRGGGSAGGGLLASASILHARTEELNNRSTLLHGEVHAVAASADHRDTNDDHRDTTNPTGRVHKMQQAIANSTRTARNYFAGLFPGSSVSPSTSSSTSDVSAATTSSPICAPDAATSSHATSAAPSTPVPIHGIRKSKSTEPVVQPYTLTPTSIGRRHYMPGSLPSMASSPTGGSPRRPLSHAAATTSTTRPVSTYTATTPVESDGEGHAHTTLALLDNLQASVSSTERTAYLTLSLLPVGAHNSEVATTTAIKRLLDVLHETETVIKHHADRHRPSPSR